MNAAPPSTLLGKGIYTVPDAARLTQVSQRRIRYWLKGLTSEDAVESEDRRLWHGELEPIDDKLALGFLDLLEVRFIDAFLKTGLSWRLLRKAHDCARQRYGIEHPFCTRRFVTDGSEVFEQLASRPAPDFRVAESPAELAGQAEEIAYEEVVRGQRVFPQVIQPFLRELEFADNDRLIRWWPLGTDRGVVLDPQRQFGQPIAARAGVATEVFHAAAKAGQQVEDIADWYEVDVQAVRDAIEFEERLVA